MTVAGWLGCARSQLFVVCWNRSTLPQVVGGWGGVLLRDVQAAQLGFEGVAAALAAGQAGGEDLAVEFLIAVKPGCGR